MFYIYRSALKLCLPNLGKVLHLKINVKALFVDLGKLIEEFLLTHSKLNCLNDLALKEGQRCKQRLYHHQLIFIQHSERLEYMVEFLKFNDSTAIC